MSGGGDDWRTVRGLTKVLAVEPSRGGRVAARASSSNGKGAPRPRCSSQSLRGAGARVRRSTTTRQGGRRGREEEHARLKTDTVVHSGRL
jgi:hypothetical protein